MKKFEYEKIKNPNDYVEELYKNLDAYSVTLEEGEGVWGKDWRDELVHVTTIDMVNFLNAQDGVDIDKLASLIRAMLKARTASLNCFIEKQFECFFDVVIYEISVFEELTPSFLYEFKDVLIFSEDHGSVSGLEFFNFYSRSVIDAYERELKFVAACEG